jgi:glycosyltransferase involved in cell wall biosynthesis
MELSIVFATFKSEAILEKSLQAYCKIVTQHQWELIIVDNADRIETRIIINKYKDLLPIVFIEQSESGKNNALNKALPLIAGDLVMFTDNDIIPSSDLVDVYVDAANKHPEVSIFSGKILPDISLPLWIDQTWHRIRSALGIYDKGEVNLSILPQDVWGGNMMLRGSIFKQGYNFNAAVGPSGKNYIMGSETELLLKLERSGFQALYVSDCQVFHQIRESQLSLSWLQQRAYRSGKGVAFNVKDESRALLGVPLYLFKKLLSEGLKALFSFIKGDKRGLTIQSMEFFHVAGKIIQSYRQ